MTLRYSFHPITKSETKEKLVKYLKGLDIYSTLVESGTGGLLLIELNNNISFEDVLEIGSMLGMHEAMFSWEDARNEDFSSEEGDDDEI